jgi:hypothetical protein
LTQNWGNTPRGGLTGWSCVGAEAVNSPMVRGEDVSKPSKCACDRYVLNGPVVYASCEAL